MALKQVRDEKDPQPNADNIKREGGDGNVPATGEMHDEGKAEYVKEGDRYTLRKGGETQPTREGGDGNVPAPAASAEEHDQKKAEYVPASKRF